MDRVLKEDDLKIRQCLESDSEYIYSLKKLTLKPYVEQIWGWDEKWNKEYFRKTFNPEIYQIIIYKNEDIGCIAFKEEGTMIEIENIEILPRYQNLGIGSYLINQIKQKITAQKKQIILQVFKINQKAIKFYAKHGFIKFDESETHFKMRFDE